jgi:hypothetical protein
MLSPEDRAAVVSRQHGACFYCGLSLGLGVIFGHVIPRHADGSHHHSNRMAVHEACGAKANARGSANAPMPTAEELQRQADMIGAASPGSTGDEQVPRLPLAVKGARLGSLRLRGLGQTL